MRDWPCDRCDADARQPCRTLKSGTPRRTAHLARWSTAAVFTLATRWLPRLPVWDRLALATRAVAGPDGGSAPAAWSDVTALLWQADQLQKALVRRVVEDSEVFVDATELRRSGLQLAAAMKEAGNLLRLQHLQDDPRRAEVETMVLPERDGAADGPARLTLAALRTARDRGQVHVMTADMTRRAAAVAEQSEETEPVRWTARWEMSGRFDATPAGPDLDGEVERPAVRGWAAHPTVVADELGRWSTRPRLADVTWRGSPPPSRTPRLCAFTPAAAPRVTEEQAAAAFMARPDLIAEIVAELDGLRRSVPRDGVAEEVAARAARLQDEEPQLPALSVPGDSWACTTAVEWVPTRAVVRTPDEVWGRFDRDGDRPGDDPDRRARWLPDRTAELLAVGYADVPAYLTRHFGAHSESGAVQLLRIPGPVGPLYTVTAGSQRAHLCRVLGLPWMFAVTTMMSLPRRIETTAVTPPDQGAEACRETAALWRGLIARGLVRGELVARHSDWVVELRVEYALAPWMLLPADRASAYNRRYELLHPGALAAAGIPDEALRSAAAWETWVAGM